MLDQDTLADLVRSVARSLPEDLFGEEAFDLLERILDGTVDGQSAIDAIIDAFGEPTERVATYYQVFFDRLPDEAGLDYWTNLIRETPTLSDEDLANLFFTAGEFQDLYGDMTPAEAVAEIYRNVLGRDPDEEGLAYWTARVLEDAEFGLEQLGQAFAEATETLETYAPLTRSYLEALANGEALPENLFGFLEEILPDDPSPAPVGLADDPVPAAEVASGPAEEPAPEPAFEAPAPDQIAFEDDLLV